jgi:hypothetical protein
LIDNAAIELNNSTNDDFWERLTSFWITLISVLLLVIIVFVLFLFLLPNYMDSNTAKIESVSNIVSLILGLPVAFAASWVAIVLAQRSYRVSKRQAETEVQTRLAETARLNRLRIDELVSDISNRLEGAYDSYRSYSSSTASVAAHYVTHKRQGKDFSNDQLYQSKLSELYTCQRKYVESLVQLSKHPITRGMFNGFDNLEKICAKFVDDDALENDSLSYVFGGVNNIQAAIELVSSCPNPMSVEKIFEIFFSPQTDSSAEIFGYDPFEDDGANLPISKLLSPISLIVLSGLLLSEDSAPIVTEMDDGEGWTHEGDESINLGGVFILDFLLQYPSDKSNNTYLLEKIKEYLGLDDGLDDYLLNRLSIYELSSVKSKVLHLAALFMKGDEVFEDLFVDSCALIGDFGEHITNHHFDFFIKHQDLYV